MGPLYVLGHDGPFGHVVPSWLMTIKLSIWYVCEYVAVCWNTVGLVYLVCPTGEWCLLAPCVSP